MIISAAGWGRFMGYKSLYDHAVSAIKSATSLGWGQTCLQAREDGIRIAFTKELHLCGSYRLQVDLSKADIAELFKIAFGSSPSIEHLASLGISVGREGIGQIVSRMTVAELLRVAQDQSLSPSVPIEVAA